MVNSKFIREAVYGLIFFGVVYTLVSMTTTIYETLAVLFGCTFVLYWFVYKIRKISFYLKSFVYLGGMVALFLLAGKIGLLAIIALHIIVPAWVIYKRRAKIKEGYVEFERVANKAFPPKKEVKNDFQEKKPAKSVKSVKPVQKKKKLGTPNKNKGKTNKKSPATGDKTKRTRKPRAVKQGRKDSAKKTTNK